MNSARMTWADRASMLWSPAGMAAVAAAGVTALAYGPLLYENFVNLGAKPYYQHYPFVLAAFAWLLSQRLMAARGRERHEHPALGRPIAAALTAAAWALLAVAYAVGSPWLAYLSLIVLVGAGMVYAGALWHVSGLGAVWLLLWLIVPPPFNRDQDLINYLQRLSSKASSFVLDALGVSHLMEGNLLTLPGKQFFVDEACSGIISVMSIIACAAIYGVWRRRSAAHVVALIAAGVAWATIMNTMRISAIAFVYSQWGVDWSEGPVHEILSLAVFTLTFLALMSSDVLLTGLLAPVALAWEEYDNRELRWGRWLAAGWDWALGHRAETAEAADASVVGEEPLALPRWPLLVRVALPLAFIALPVWGLMRGEQADVVVIAGSGAGEATINRALAIDKPFLPQRVGSLRFERFDSQERDRDDAMGNHSRSHVYLDSRGTTYLVSCDFAYEGGWHELTLCYQGVGWTLEDRSIHADSATADGQPWPRMEAEFSKPNGAKAFVVASAFDELGQTIDLPTWSVWESLANLFHRKRMIQSGQLGFQTQVWVTSNEPIDDDQRKAARKLLLAGRQPFHDLVVGVADASTDSAIDAKGAP